MLVYFLSAGQQILTGQATRDALLKSISTDRLTKYLALAGGDLTTALRLYEYNAHISETFYFPLQCVEVCFRNALNDQLVQSFGENWFEGAMEHFKPREATTIASTIERMRDRSQAVSCGAVVAEFKFAFWVNLTDRKYDEGLWRSTVFRAFQKGPGRNRRLANNRFNQIRRFRNRVFHHEPILTDDFATMRDDIFQAISWICDETANWARRSSRAMPLSPE